MADDGFVDDPKGLDPFEFGDRAVPVADEPKLIEERFGQRIVGGDIRDSSPNGKRGGLIVDLGNFTLFVNQDGFNVLKHNFMISRELLDPRRLGTIVEITRSPFGTFEHSFRQPVLTLGHRGTTCCPERIEDIARTADRRPVQCDRHSYSLQNGKA